MNRITCLLLLVLIGYSSYGQDTTYHKRLYLGTGEYSPTQAWHAVLRFEQSEAYNSEPGSVIYAPEGTIPLHECFDGGTMLNFGHGFYLDEGDNRMFLSTLFTNSNNVLTTNSDTAVGSIAIFDNIHTLTGPQSPSRHIFGPNTQLKQPHSCWLDESRDMLYVPNTFGQNILVFNNASTLTGDVIPDRIIDSDSLGYPVYIYVDSVADRMFVCAMPGPPSSGEPNAQILIYNNASTLTNLVDPDIRITGGNTRLAMINQTVHNCQWSPGNQLLAVGHHTNELLFFDLSSINWNPSGTDVLDLTPRVLRVDDPAQGHDSTDVNLYGLYWDTDTDTIYCSVGVDNPGGGPMQGSPPNALKIYGNVSSSSMTGIIAPDRQIYWGNANSYYPPQPIWVQDYMTITTTTGLEEEAFNKALDVYPNPSTGSTTIQLSGGVHFDQVQLLSIDGRLIDHVDFSSARHTYLFKHSSNLSGVFIVRVFEKGLLVGIAKLVIY